ncbi:RNA polymerase epsilon subunit [Streptococcus dentiloxodontae]
MIYKVFYQEVKERNPRREQTQTIYLDINADNELEGRIVARKLIEENTAYNIEYIELLSEKALEYEKETGVFEVTEF